MSAQVLPPAASIENGPPSLTATTTIIEGDDHNDKATSSDSSSNSIDGGGGGGLTTSEQILLPDSPLRAPVSRVVTKESLGGGNDQPQRPRAVTNDSNSSSATDQGDDYGNGSGSEDHDDLFEFSLLDNDNHKDQRLEGTEDNETNELLSLPLATIDLPRLTPPPPEDNRSSSPSSGGEVSSFASEAATLLTPAVSESDSSSSSGGSSGGFTPRSDFSAPSPPSTLVVNQGQGQGGNKKATTTTTTATAPTPAAAFAARSNHFRGPLAIRAPPVASVSTTTSTSTSSHTALPLLKKQQPLRPRSTLLGNKNSLNSLNGATNVNGSKAINGKRPTAKSARKLQNIRSPHQILSTHSISVGFPSSTHRSHPPQSKVLAAKLGLAGPIAQHLQHQVGSRSVITKRLNMSSANNGNISQGMSGAGGEHNQAPSNSMQGTMMPTQQGGTAAPAPSSSSSSSPMPPRPGPGFPQAQGGASSGAGRGQPLPPPKKFGAQQQGGPGGSVQGVPYRPLPANHHHHQAMAAGQANGGVMHRGGPPGGVHRPGMAQVGRARAPSAGPSSAPAPAGPSSSAPQPSSGPSSSSASSSAAGAASGPGAVENTGRWTAEEHRLFLQGLEQHGKGWKKIATLIKSRTVVQIRTHAQKYFQKLAKARQNGDAVGGVGMGTVGGAAGEVGGGHHGGRQVVGVVGAIMPGGLGPEGEGIPIPMTADGQPVVTMRTTSGVVGHHQPLPHHPMGNMAIGTDPTSMAAAAGNVAVGTGQAHHHHHHYQGPSSGQRGGGMGGGRKRRVNAPNAGTKRRAIGNVVRSAVREGRNIKRQKIAETKRNKGRRASIESASSGGSAGTAGLSPSPSSVPSAVAVPSSSGNVNANAVIGADGKQVPNPLPAVSSVLDPYVTATMGMPPPGANAAGGQVPQAASKAKGRGRQQMVHTATHGTLPMAALEDAVFRLLTPATGAPAPGAAQPPHPAAVPGSGAGIVDPLAPSQSNAKVPVAHTQYHHHHPAPQGGNGVATTNPSPTGVVDMSLLPSWVDAKNPPSWYNEGSDIDTLLEDAEALNWLSDTGDLEETYPPAVAEPAMVSSSGSANAMTVMPEPTPVVADPTGGVVHPSHESLSFLMDPPDQSAVAAVAGAPTECVDHLPAFLEEPPAPPSPTPADMMDDHRPPVDHPEEHRTLSENVDAVASATEAMDAACVEAVTEMPAVASEQNTLPAEPDAAGLMGFPDLDMGDEQAFVSALLENSGQGTAMSFPKLGSDVQMHMHSATALNEAIKEEGEELAGESD